MIKLALPILHPALLSLYEKLLAGFNEHGIPSLKVTLIATTLS